MKYSLHEINELIKDDDTYTTLKEYCTFLENKYKYSLENKYKVKYDDLYNVLYSSISDDKMIELFNSFATSMDIYPIIKITLNGICLRSF
jgi:hypothetical protein